MLGDSGYRAVYVKGYLAGQLAMRERAARVAEGWYNLPDIDSEGLPTVVPTVEKIVGRRIRTLQPEEPK